MRAFDLPSKNSMKLKSSYLDFYSINHFHPLLFSGGVGTIVLAVALATSAASIGSEIYFAIEKCCGVYPQACRDRDEFKEIEKRMGVTTKEIDNKALDSK